MQIKTAMVAGMLAVASYSWAADGAGNYAIWGSGNTSCFNYNKSRQAGSEQAFKDYVMGYLTAYNTISEDTYNISANMNLAAILAWLDDYCTEKQVHGFDQAVTSFVIEHHDNRHKRPPTAAGRWVK